MREEWTLLIWIGGSVGNNPSQFPEPVQGATVYGRGGNDFIEGSYDHDWIEGGEGHDAVSASAGDDVVMGGEGNDFLSGGYGDDIVVGNDLFNASPSTDNNLLAGDRGDDMLFGGEGIDWLYGDTKVAASGARLDTGERMWLGENFPGNLPTPFFDFQYDDGSGIDFQDALLADPLEGAGNDYISGGGGDDKAYGGAGDDQIFGGDGQDSLFGEAGNDWLSGGEGDDHLYGDFDVAFYANDQRVVAQNAFGGDVIWRIYQDPVNVAGNDVLDGGAGKDVLKGGHGNDVYVFGRGYGVDAVYDDAGTDRVRLGAGIKSSSEVYKY